MRMIGVALGTLLALGVTAPAAARVTNASVESDGSDKLVVKWSGAQAVDVYRAATPDADIAAAAPVVGNDRDGRETVPFDPAHHYFLLRDTSDGSVTRVAERVLPLAQGSNFRDVGGYPAADDKHVRWGMIFRSGATPMLTPGDLDLIHDLGLRTMVDLRSSEERQIAPTKIENVTYTTYNYSVRTMLGSAAQTGARPVVNSQSLYTALPQGLVPQLRIVFASLLRKEPPLVYNCTAGQDRTGFTTAMILSALGVPREVILQDYVLSTRYRRPQYEVPPIDAATQASNPLAKMFAENAKNPAQPLIDADGKPFLLGAFTQIDRQWGSVDGYLQKAIGLSPADIATLRAEYLE